MTTPAKPLPFDVWVSDTTPIILLGKIGLTSLMAGLSGDGIIPQAVADEINAGPEDEGRQALRDILLSPGARLHTPRPRRDVDRFRLDAGEAAVLAAAMAEIENSRRVLVVMDEAKGRFAARELGLETIGTVGLLIRAKTEFQLEAIVPHLHALKARDAWLSDNFCQKVAQSVGENWP